MSDALGFTTSSGLDVNDDDELDAANGDRFTTSRTYYAKAPAPDNQWWQTTDTTSWITPTQSQTTRTSNLMNAADGETQKTTRNLGTACESTTTITRTFNPGNHVITTTTTGPAGTYSSTDTTDSTGNRIVQTAVPDITNPANPQTSALEINQYDAYGRPILHTDPRGATTLSFHYSGTNQLERVTDQLDNSTHYTYYPSNDPHAGMVATVTDNGGGTTTTTYNSRGQTEEITGNAAYHQAFVYDDYGDQYSLTTYGTVTATTIWHHDGPTGLLTFKEYQGGSGTHYTYTADGKICTRLWQRGVTTTYSYNSATGDLTNVAYSGTNDTTPSVTFSNHDLLGRPHTVVESRPVIINNNPTIINDTTTLSYDLVTGAESTTYDSGHSLLPDLSLTAKAPDANGFPPGYNLNNGSNPVHDWTYTNDAFGRVVSLASGGFTVEFSPQPGTRQVREQTTKLNTTTIHQSTRGIDMLGRVTGMVSRAPDFSVSGHPVRIIASAGHHYDARSRRKDTRREDGSLWQYGYDDRSEVTSAVKTTANSQLVPGQSFGYVFDGMGNRVTSTAGTGSNAAVTNYGRNALNRYTSITTPGVADILARSDSQQGISFTVDENPVTPTNIGNLYNAHATVANSPDGKYSSISITSGSTTKTGHRWTAPASVTPQYDDDGNLKQDGRWLYDWDAENRLVKMTTLQTAINAGAPNLTIEYSYDWRSRNIGRKVTGGSNPSDERIIYDGWNPVAEFSVSSGQLVNKKTLLWGPDLSGTLQGAGGVGGLVLVSDRRTTTAAYYIPSYNTNGDIIAWSDPTGQLIRRMDYDPFGNLILCETFTGDSTDLDSFLTHGFSTKPADPDTGLLYYGFRWYDAVTGRWLSVDPIEEMGGLNIYSYAHNNGPNLFDILGCAAFVLEVSYFKPRSTGDDFEKALLFEQRLTIMKNRLKALIARLDDKNPPDKYVITDQEFKMLLSLDKVGIDGKAWEKKDGTKRQYQELIEHELKSTWENQVRGTRDDTIARVKMDAKMATEKYDSLVLGIHGLETIKKVNFLGEVLDQAKTIKDFEDNLPAKLQTVSCFRDGVTGQYANLTDESGMCNVRPRNTNIEPGIENNQTPVAIANRKFCIFFFPIKVKITPRPPAPPNEQRNELRNLRYRNMP